jgi:hypothetical protein
VQKIQDALAALAEGFREMQALGAGLLAAVTTVDAASSLTDVLDALDRQARQLSPTSSLWVAQNSAFVPWARTPGPGPVASIATGAVAAAPGAWPLSVGGQVVAILRDEGAKGMEAGDHASPRAIMIEILTRFAARKLEAITARRSAELMAAQMAGRVDRESRPAATTTVDEEGARRYARLLVSEIRLYHEPAIAEGRRSRDLGERLAGEIARARSLYNQRVGDDERLAQLFRDELVRTLADGDATLV